MEDDIVILDEASPVAAAHISRRAVAVVEPIALTAASIVTEPEIVEVVLPPKPILYQDEHQVYALDRQLYFKSSPYASTVMGYSTYAYMSSSQLAHIEAASMMHGSIPVFAPTQADLDVFKVLLQRFTITVQPGHCLLFFVEQDKQRQPQVSEADCTTLMWDGAGRLTWKTGTSFYTLNENGPVTTSAKKIFDEVSTFIGKTTKKVRETLASAEANLADVKRMRSEDIYLYVSGVTPPEDKKDIHDIVVSRFEAAYAVEQRQTHAYETEIKTLTQKIKDARSQLPSGRKGTAIKAAYLASPILSELLEELTVHRDGSYMYLTFAFKKDLFVEYDRGQDEDGDDRSGGEIFYGRPVVCMTLIVDRSAGRDGTHIKQITATSMDLRAFMHPHLESDQRWCLGTYITAMNNAFLGGNIPMLTALVWEYLNRYNDESPLVNIDTCATQMAAANPHALVVRRK